MKIGKNQMGLTLIEVMIIVILVAIAGLCVINDPTIMKSLVGQNNDAGTTVIAITPTTTNIPTLEQNCAEIPVTIERRRAQVLELRTKQEGLEKLLYDTFAQKMKNADKRKLANGLVGLIKIDAESLLGRLIPILDCYTP